ncbi:O-antigen ligase family protein [Chondromyces crocatus]|uniref:O-antigen ligase family protein n=1 Tax=Chondromyces crocatus TaxID=52 RepID=UPI0012E2DBBF|nr:O-antigen ligase family protein [Chondromyces crocatus]
MTDREGGPSGETTLGARARAGLLGASAALAALIWDPAAPAATAKHTVLLLAAAVALAVVLGQGARHREVAGRTGAEGISSPAALWLGFVGWSVVSLAWGHVAGMGMLCAWVAVSALMLAAMRLPAGGARWAALVAGGCLGGGSSLFALAQVACGGRGFAIHGGHGNPNWLGLVLAVSLPLTIELAWVSWRAGSRWWLAAAGAAVVSLPALLLARSRVAWIALGVTLAVGLVVGAHGRYRRAVRLVASGAMGMLAVGLVVVSRGGLPLATSAGVEVQEAPFASEAVGAEVPTVIGGVDVPLASAWDGRVRIWRASADAARAALPFGVGLGAFAPAYLEAQGKRLARLSPPQSSRQFLNATTAHNDWLQAAAEGGLPGVALLAAAIAWGIRVAWRAGWFAGAASLGTFALCAWGDSPLQQPAVALLMALTLAASGRRDRGAASSKTPVVPRSGEGDPFLWTAGAPAALGLVAVALLLAVATRSWLSARQLSDARDVMPAARSAMIERAVRLDPWNGEARLALGLARLEEGDAAGALGVLECSRALLANVGTDVAIGNAHLELDAPAAAVSAYRRALRHHPGSLRAHANLVEALVRVGKLDDAEVHLDAARSISPGHPRMLAITERVRRARLDAEASGAR